MGGEDGRGPSAGGKTDGEKLAAATRSGVVKIVEVKKKKRRDGDEMSRKQNVVATGRDALLALLGDGAEAAGDGDGAWGGGGWGLEEEKADAEEDEERRRKKTKTRASLDDAGARDVATLKVFSSEKKKKKRRDADDFDDFDDFDARLGASAKKKKREDDPWNDDESKRRRKQAMLSKKKKKQNVLARRYKK